MARMGGDDACHHSLSASVISRGGHVTTDHPEFNIEEENSREESLHDS
jgi:hypothetical protein